MGARLGTEQNFFATSAAIHGKCQLGAFYTGRRGSNRRNHPGGELHSKADQIKGRIVLIDTEHAFAEGFNKTYPS
jgi:hypothetical protein